MQINYVCSFGSIYHTSQIIKKNKLKLCSYPFDWIFIDYNNIIHCIENNFKIFLDKKYYTSISKSRCGHTYYNNNMWWHHNPLVNQKDYDYYKRCIDRFKKLLNNDENKLFIILLPNMSDINEDIKNNIINFNDKFSKYTNNYILLVILHLGNKDENNYIFTYNNNIHFLELHTLSISNGLTFINEKDNSYLDDIIKEAYNFNLKK